MIYWIECAKEDMMWSTSYIISQILTLFVYGLFCLSYFQSRKKNVLETNILAHVLQTIAFYLIGGYTGMAMDIILIFRDNFFYKEELLKGNKTRKNVLLFSFLLIIIISTIFTYNGFLSLLSVFATMISTYAIWQDKVEVYRFLGIPVSMLWLGYQISLNAIFAIILESILLISTIIGYVKEKNRKQVLKIRPNVTQ
jgi:hypothetical protein